MNSIITQVGKLDYQVSSIP